MPTFDVLGTWEFNVTDVSLVDFTVHVMIWDFNDDKEVRKKWAPLPHTLEGEKVGAHFPLINALATTPWRSGCIIQTKNFRKPLWFRT
jgi:hypothetical protein